MGFHITSIEQARNFIGERLTVSTYGRRVTNTVARVDPAPGGVVFELWMDNGKYWPLPDTSTTFELADSETPSERVARLKAQAEDLAEEIAEAEAAARVASLPELPHGYDWTKAVEPRMYCGQTGFGLEVFDDFRAVVDLQGRQAVVNLSALAAFVDVAMPERAAPKAPAIPEGWTRDDDEDGPILANGSSSIECMHDGLISTWGNDITPDAMRAFLALLDE